MPEAVATSAPLVRAPVVSMRGIEHRFSSGFVLSVPEWGVASGAHTACIGPSGCGKTTLLRLMAGIIEPTTGSIELFGEPLDQCSVSQRRSLRLGRVGIVFQQLALLEHLSALDNMLLPRLVAGGASRADRERARELAEATGIAGTLTRKPSRLSQGERQRVAICRSLVTSPELVVCDEPTGNLDPARSRSVVELLMAEANKIGATVVLVTHDHGLLDLFGSVLDLGPANGLANGAASDAADGGQP